MLQRTDDDDDDDDGSLRAAYRDGMSEYRALAQRHRTEDSDYNYNFVYLHKV